MSSAIGLAKGADFASGRPYIERAETEARWHDRLAETLYRTALGPLRNRFADSRLRLERIVGAVDAHDAALRMLGDAELQLRAAGMRAPLRRLGFTLASAAECFAIVREAAFRTTGRRHFATQLMAGYALLQGKLVEMATGEGKTFAATLPACAVALAGYPVHVITVNDYLAARDADEMAALYRFLGLSVGTVVQGMQKPARRAGYACAVTYCTNKELAFDYLRDRVAIEGRSSALHRALDRLRGDSGVAAADGGLVLRGLHFAIVDEADSVFVDEARTPLILSAAGQQVDDAAPHRVALGFVASLIEGEDYAHDPFERSVRLSDTGKGRLDDFALGRDGIWASIRAREEMVHQALSAVLLYHRDQHYVVADGKVQIIDESTGRVMPDRSWEHGLHQMIEAKEDCEPTERRTTLARLTYQRLFRRYVRLSGMTGTATEVAREIESVYRLPVAHVPLRRPSQRLYARPVVCPTAEEKWSRVADAAARLALVDGRPVLIGTRSVMASEEISTLLGRRGIEHALLNAKQDRSEADVISQAGQAGRVTVATNMAGRGTDIRLGPGVAEKGGLHVILTEYHESRRIDRQLFGRCARQGDPGSCQAIVSLEDEIFQVCAPTMAAGLQRVMQSGMAVPDIAFAALKAMAQHRAEARNAVLRAQNLKYDRRLGQVLSFSGRGE